MPFFTPHFFAPVLRPVSGETAEAVTPTFRGGDLEVTTTGDAVPVALQCQCSSRVLTTEKGTVARSATSPPKDSRPFAAIRAHSRYDSKPVAHETRWMKRLLGNFRALSSACFLDANGREWPRICTNGIHGGRQSINRVDEVGRSVPVSRWDGRTRGIDPARWGRLALPVFSRGERRNQGGALCVHRPGNSRESLYAVINPKEARHSCRAGWQTREL